MSSFPSYEITIESTEEIQVRQIGPERFIFYSKIPGIYYLPIVFHDKIRGIPIKISYETKLLIEVTSNNLENLNKTYP